MKKLGITLAMLLASTALASANMLVTARECIGAVCGPQFIFTDPGNTISVNQPVGDFTVVITGTQDNPPGVGGIMLSGTDISIRDNTGVAGTITVTVTGQGYTTTVPAFESSFTQNLITGSAMTMQTFTDFANNIGGTQLSTFIPPTIPNINGNQIFTETRLGQGADLLETRGRDDLSNRAIEVS